MDPSSVLLLSRLQFALTIMFHYLFPPLSIGLGLLMVFMEGLYLWTKNPQYEAMAKFWTKIFAANFAMGVASGIVMEFQFGTNWATYSRYVGDVFGSALAAEGIFAFFLESGFLAVLVFGWDRVSPKMHFFATLMVALGAIFSAVWIVIANSWQQTPAGSHVVQTAMGARAEIVDFWAVVFNPSSMPRLAHVLIGSFILGAFFVMSISAFYLLRRRHEDFAKKSFTIALFVAAASSILAGATGHLQGEIVAKHQPAKLAAQEGHLRKTPSGAADLYLFGIVDEANLKVHGIAVPGGLSMLLHNDFSAPVPALEEFDPSVRPPVAIPFYAFHLMVGLGTFFIVLTLGSLLLLWRGTLFQQRWLLWIFVFAVVGPYLANQAGWVAAEVGRQPFVVYPTFEKTETGWKIAEGHEGLRTADAVSRAIKADQVLASIILFGLIYLLLFAVWIYVLHSKIMHGPDEPAVVAAEAPAKTSREALWETAGRLHEPESGYSLTSAHEQPKQSKGKKE